MEIKYMNRLRQFWQRLEDNQKLKNVLEKIIRVWLGVVFVYFLYMFVGMSLLVYVWGKSEDAQIQNCVQDGQSFDDCWDMYNW